MGLLGWFQYHEKIQLFKCLKYGDNRGGWKSKDHIEAKAVKSKKPGVPEHIYLYKEEPTVDRGEFEG